MKARLEGQQKVGSILPSGDGANRTVPSYDGRTTARPMGGTAPSMQQSRPVTSGVKEQSIKIPDFFKK